MKHSLLGLSFLVGFANASDGGEASVLQMWYKQPAVQWDHGIPVGNGRLGAMVLGGVSNERIVINEESVWSRNGEYTDKPGGHAHSTLR